MRTDPMDMGSVRDVLAFRRYSSGRYQRKLTACRISKTKRQRPVNSPVVRFGAPGG
jgi:hypothetical protein